MSGSFGSKQTCHYCKATGHRIHAMNAVGVYIRDSDGECVLACPVLIQKAEQKTKRVKNADEEFPALPGQAGGASVSTINLVNAIDNAIKDKKHKEWLERKVKKEERERVKAAREKAALKETAKQLETKYGPRWAWVVTKTDEDNSIAYTIRYDYMVARMERDAEDCRLAEEMEMDEEERDKNKRAQRKARRALMSAKDAILDKEDEAEELEAEWENGCIQHELMQEYAAIANRREQAFYKTNGWVWVERN